MKKTLIALLVVAVLISVVACSNTDNGKTDPSNGTGTLNPSDRTPAQSEQTEPKDSESEKTTVSEKTDPEGSDPEAEAVDPKTMIEKIYKVQPIEFDVMTEAVDLKDADALKNYTGLSKADGVKAAAYSESMIMPSTYSLVIVQTESAADTKDIAEAMQKGIDPAKWVCVCSDDVKIVTKDDLIMLIMNSSESEPSSDDFVKAFTELCGEPDLTLKK